MNKNDVYALIQLGQVLPKACEGDLVELVYLSRRLHRLYEHICNGYLELEAKSVQKAEKRVKILVASIRGVSSVSFNRDPRGYPIHLKLKSHKSNSWHGGVWAI